MGDLATVTQVQAWAPQLASVSSADIERVLDAVAEALARRLGRPYLADGTGGWLTGTQVEQLDGSEGRTLYLAYTPISSITSVEIVTGSSSTSTVSSDLYTFEADSGALHYYESEGLSLAAFQNPDLNAGRWPRGIRNVKATYVGGYANQAAVPGDLEQLAIEMTVAVYNERGKDRSLSSESVGGYAYALASGADGGVWNQRIMDLASAHLRGAGVV
ncbi:MAG: hypothetical protein DWQ20_00685 [Actinobacteria bacterium]|nr:MAG: hypothetical protein DWQ20_00685 [Actinomycetota bacterium]